MPGAKSSRTSKARAESRATYDERVFLNVPFDDEYLPIFHALVFAAHDCGLQARCALESHDGSVVRIDKLYRIMDACRLGIHDICRTQLDPIHKLPRFNMPLELGIFLGAKRYGPPLQRRKMAMILDEDRHRYQKYCSDIAGQDIRAHNNQDRAAIKAVRDWLDDFPTVRRLEAPGPKIMADRYDLFKVEMPKMCAARGLDESSLTFFNYQSLVVAWLKVNRDWKGP